MPEVEAEVGFFPLSPNSVSSESGPNARSGFFGEARETEEGVVVAPSAREGIDRDDVVVVFRLGAVERAWESIDDRAEFTWSAGDWVDSSRPAICVDASWSARPCADVSPLVDVF